ncbi:MAG: hypothetical protein ACYTHM_24485, partial [Planctomycetota bacterium]
FWRFIYLPAEIRAGLRSAKVSGLQARESEIPPAVAKHPGAAVPFLIDKLLCGEEEEALCAFVSLRHSKRGLDRLREMIENEVFPEEGRFRAALLLEKCDADVYPGSSRGQGREPTSAWLPGGKSGYEFRLPPRDESLEPGFQSRFLRWKLRSGKGKFDLGMGEWRLALWQFIEAEKGDAIPFLLELLRSPSTPKKKVDEITALMVASYRIMERLPHVLDLKNIPDVLLNALSRCPTRHISRIMGALHRSGNRQQKKTAFEYLRKMHDPVCAEALESWLASADTPIKERMKAARVLLAWHVEWLARILRRWPIPDVEKFMESLSPWPPRSQKYSLFKFLKVLGEDDRRQVPRMAIEFVIDLEENRWHRPYGTRRIGLAEEIKALESGDWSDERLNPKFFPLLREAAEVLDRALLEGRLAKSRGDLIRAAAMAVTPGMAVTDRGWNDSNEHFTGFAGQVLFHYAHDPPGLSGLIKALVALVRESEYQEGNLQALFWMALVASDLHFDKALSRKDLGDLRYRLKMAVEVHSIHQRYVCAAARACLERDRIPHRQTREAWRRGLAQPFHEALTGANPVLAFLAAREVVQLPPCMLAERIPALLALSRTGDPRLIVVSEEALGHILCHDEAEAVRMAERFPGDHPDRALETVWLGVLGLDPVEPRDPSLLLRVAEAMGRAESDHEIRAADFLLRLWTGRRMGLVPHVKALPHGWEAAKRWMAWFEEDWNGLVWDDRLDRYRRP